jgi:hypothetical protein
VQPYFAWLVSAFKFEGLSISVASLMVRNDNGYLLRLVF